jgi:type IV pilus assembly protein PilM
LVVAVPKAIVDSYYDAVSSAGLTPIAIEIDMISTIRALTLEHGDLAPFLIADIGANLTTIAICKNQIPYFTSSIPISGKSFTEALQKELGMIEETAEKTKIDFAKEELQDKETIERIYAPLFENLASEIEKSIAFYHESITPEDHIEVIVLTGGSSRIKNLTESLGTRLDKRVIIGSISLNAHQKCTKIAIPDDKIVRYTTSIGLALRGYDYEGYHKSFA